TPGGGAGEARASESRLREEGSSGKLPQHVRLPAVGRELGDAFVLHRLGERRLIAFDRRQIADNSHGLGYVPKLKLNVDGARLGRAEHNAFAHVRFEARERRHDAVGAWLKGREGIYSRLIRHRFKTT